MMQWENSASDYHMVSNIFRSSSLVGNFFNNYIFIQLYYYPLKLVTVLSKGFRFAVWYPDQSTIYLFLLSFQYQSTRECLFSSYCSSDFIVMMGNKWMLNHSIYQFQKFQRVKSWIYVTQTGLFLRYAMKHWYTSASSASVASACEMISFHCLEPDLPILENWFKLILCNLSVISLGASACNKWPWFRGVSAWFKCWIRGVSACDLFKCWIGTIKSSSSGVISLLRLLEIPSFYAMYQKSWSYATLLLRYVWQMWFLFFILGYVLPFYPPNNQHIKIIKK